MCAGPVPPRERGRPAVYCSRSCQAKAYRARKSDAAAGMASREAARLAAWHAGLAIESALANGWPALDRYGADRARVEEALNTLRVELEHRAAGPAPKKGRRTAPQDPPRVTKPAESVTQTPAPSTAAPTAPGVGQAAPTPAVTKLPEPVTQPEAVARVFKPVPGLGADWSITDEYGEDSRTLWWKRTDRVGTVGHAWQAGRRAGWQTSHGPDRYPTRHKALTALATRYDLQRKQATPHASVPVQGLGGWQLTQSQADHDAKRWNVLAPDGEVAGILARPSWAPRSWEAFSGTTPINPAGGREVWKDRMSAARAIAQWHDPELTARQE